MTSDGLVVVDKPGGLTSHDVVARVRRLAGTRRVGHAGTLDPMATGVLVLGATTVTDDAEGEVVTTADARGVTDDALRAGVFALTGDLQQVPSAVSAVKIDGKRAYKRVREGEDVVLPPRAVTVRTFEVLDVRRDAAVVDVDARVECSTGTYVRALARDLGAALGVGGHLTALRRTRVGPYGLDVAHTLDELADELIVLPIADAARAAFPSRDLDSEATGVIAHGGPLPATGRSGPVAVFAPDGTFLALVEDRGATTKALAVFV